MDDQPGPLQAPPPTRPKRGEERGEIDTPGIREREPTYRPDDLEHYEELPGTRVATPGEAAPRRAARAGERRALWIALALAVAAAIAWYAFRAGHQAPPTSQSPGPMSVGTARVEKGDMPVVLSGLGTVTPLGTVTVKTQINGQLLEVAFQEGQIVKKGDFLAQIDPRPYEVALAQAQGQLAKDEAALKNAETDLARYRTLVAQNSIARQTLDTQVALVQQDRAVIEADQAQIAAQKLNLIYCHIIAPLAGRVGLRQVDAGNYVQTSDPGGIVIITQIQPISVIFTLPEDNLPAVMKQLHAGASLEATAFDRTGTTRLGTGRLETVDNQIDTTTGTVKLRAIFDNPEEILFPNQFVNMQLRVDIMHDQSLVPIAAIQHGAPGTFVYLVKPDNTVTAQPVTLGPSEAQRIAVVTGLELGQLIVTDGADRLKDGAKVVLAENRPGAGPPAGANRPAAAASPAGPAAPAQAAPAASPPAAPSPGPAQGRGPGQQPRPAGK